MVDELSCDELPFDDFKVDDLPFDDLPFDDLPFDDLPFDDYTLYQIIVENCFFPGKKSFSASMKMFNLF
jgi:hypothetical protein